MSPYEKGLFAVIMILLASILELLHLFVDDCQALGTAKYAVISSTFVPRHLIQEPRRTTSRSQGHPAPLRR